VATGILSLWHGDTKVGEGRIKAQPGLFEPTGEGLCVGRDSGAAVTDDYAGRPPHRFTSVFLLSSSDGLAGGCCGRGVCSSTRLRVA
jgi:hypothetical protein